MRVQSVNREIDGSITIDSVRSRLSQKISTRLFSRRHKTILTSRVLSELSGELSIRTHCVNSRPEPARRLNYNEELAACEAQFE